MLEFLKQKQRNSDAFCLTITPIGDQEPEINCTLLAACELGLAIEDEYGNQTLIPWTAIKTIIINED